MSKKKFSSGLDSLFVATSEDEYLNDLPIDERNFSAYNADEVATPVRIIKRTKDFTTSFDSFFDDSFERFESIRADEQSQSSLKDAGTKKPFRKPISGIDGLIRSTMDDSGEYNPLLKKRITMILDSQKVTRLQEIAKQESIYFKDFMHDLVMNYLREYDKKIKLA